MTKSVMKYPCQKVDTQTNDYLGIPSDHNVKNKKNKQMKKLLLITVGFICFAQILYSQDYSFSNHNIVPFSQNPSLAGNANAPRFGLNYRMQWPTLGNKYHTVRASYDQNFYKQMCSVGAAFSHDNMAGGIIQVNELDLVYAHTINLKEFYYIRMGLQVGLFANYLDWNKLTFEDQYDPGTGSVLPHSIETTAQSDRSLLDFSFGATFVIENLLTVGGAVYHISQPENGFAKEEENTLYRKFVVNANFIQDLQYANGLFGRNDVSGNYFFANASYQQQADFKLAYLGVGVSIDPLLIGASLKNDLKEVNTLSLMLGGQFKGLQAYYIYDFFTSKKKNGSWSHEISFIYILKRTEKYPCPVVYW
jgi:type IX secretion system PorP/SprF family membrane protein